MTDDTRDLRRRLFRELTIADSPLDLIDVQASVASAVIEAEGRKQQASSKHQRLEAAGDIRMYRSYCDAIAWMLLHPHTIRQLADRPGRPPSLSSLGSVLDRAIALARAPAANGVPAIVSDVTNILRVADVVLVRHPEIPDLLELKGDKVIAPLDLLGPDPDMARFTVVDGGQFSKGRAGRQISVIRDIRKYLADGTGKIFGNEATKVAIESSVEPIYHWAELEELVTDCLHHGQSCRKLTEGHWLIATHEGGELQKDDELAAALPQFDRPVVACHYRALDETWSSISTPFNWPLTDETRFALMEGDVLVTTLFDVGQLRGIECDGATIVGVGVDDQHVGLDAVQLSLDGETYTLSSRFLMETLYGFRTRESMVMEMCDFLVQSHTFHKERDAC